MAIMDRILENSAKSVGIGKKDKVIVAVSGGIDSVVLFDLLLRIFGPKNIIIAHVNHGIRKESDREEKFINELSQKYGVEAESIRLKLGKASEETSRKKRYDFLHQVKEKHGAKYIAIAHHLNDQAETILLKLARGTGPLELWGMKELENDLWRPLLGIPKSQIEAYAKKRKLKYVTDKSNSDLKYARNRIRHMVIPELEKINPALLGTISRETTIANELDRYIKDETSKATKRMLKSKEIDLKKFLLLDEFIQKQLLIDTMNKLTPRESGIYQKNVDEILKIAKSRGNKKSKIAGFTIAKIYDKIIFDFEGKRTQIREGKQENLTHFENWVFVFKQQDGGKTAKNNIFVPIKMEKTISVRNWKPGDRIKTKIGTKKLQDIFTDAKISATDRKKWPIVVCGEEIIWVPLLQASIYATTKPIGKNLKIEVKIEKK